jgi:hypothetical protein
VPRLSENSLEDQACQETWQKVLDAYQEHFNEEKAISQAAATHDIERYFTFANFKRSAERCAEEMKSFGLTDVQVESFPADSKTSWSGWRAMKAWSVNYARLQLISPKEQLICDWADGQRSLLEIVERLEFEREELKRDTFISRTSSDTAIEAASSERINLKAVLYVVDKLVKFGFLGIVD